MQELRTFIAVKTEPQPALLQCLGHLKKSLSGEPIRWAPENNLHLTLKFLGKTTPRQVKEIKNQLHALGDSFPAFRFDLKGTGYFKSKGQPRVLFIKIENDALLQQLAAEIDARVSLYGFEKEKRPFRPHLTLGRIKYLRNRGRFFSMAEKYTEKYFQQVTIREIIFFQSILERTGARYKPLEIIPLQKEALPPGEPASGLLTG